jgi:hypothetical protein
VRASDIATLPFQLGSAARKRRVFHPMGVMAEGSLNRVAPAGEGLPITSTEVLARVSKAIGIPGGLPDLIGLAWRMPPRRSTERPWDVLLASAGSGPFSRCALRPTATWAGTTLSTLMPLRRPDGWWWLTAKMTTRLDGKLSLETVRQAINSGGIAFDVQQAHGTSPFTTLAELTLTAAIPTDSDHDTSFDPARNTAPGVALGPEWLTQLRESAYRLSRRGRDAPDEAAF